MAKYMQEAVNVLTQNVLKNTVSVLEKELGVLDFVDVKIVKIKKSLLKIMK